MWMISNGKQSITISISKHQRMGLKAAVRGAQKNQGDQEIEIIGQEELQEWLLEQREGGELSVSLSSRRINYPLSSRWRSVDSKLTYLTRRG